uniref:Uncharacterized protein n=1 Tax=Oryza punctata TaxID=4537 RepID=A0A0E0M4X0_ORYPU
MKARTTTSSCRTTSSTFKACTAGSDRISTQSNSFEPTVVHKPTPAVSSCCFCYRAGSKA